MCDDYWDDMDATVVCRMLGFNSGIAFKGPAGGGPFGKVNLKTAGMYYFECNGPELSIFDCKHRTTYHCTVYFQLNVCHRSGIAQMVTS